MSHTITNEDLKKHLNGVETMSEENVKNAIKQRNFAWKLVFWLLILATLLVVGIVLMLPLKTSEPYVIKVEETTGIVEVLRPLDDSSIPQDEAITKYFIVKFMNCREQYARIEAEKCYEEISKLSSQELFREYHAWFNPSNEESPLHVYGANKTVDIDITSISFLNENTANVRYKKIIKGHDGSQETSYWISTLAFKYVLSPATEQERYVNPLGFIVTSYRNDPEVIQGK